MQVQKSSCLGRFNIGVAAIHGRSGFLCGFLVPKPRSSILCGCIILLEQSLHPTICIFKNYLLVTNPVKTDFVSIS